MSRSHCWRRLILHLWPKYGGSTLSWWKWAMSSQQPLVGGETGIVFSEAKTFFFCPWTSELKVLEPVACGSYSNSVQDISPFPQTERCTVCSPGSGHPMWNHSCILTFLVLGSLSLWCALLPIIILLRLQSPHYFLLHQAVSDPS